MAETDTSQFHRGQGTGENCNLPQGPEARLKHMGCAIFSKNPVTTPSLANDRAVWGRWAHEIGHAFQQGGPAHPSNYNNSFELMDRSYPGRPACSRNRATRASPAGCRAATTSTLSRTRHRPGRRPARQWVAGWSTCARSSTTRPARPTTRPPASTSPPTSTTWSACAARCWATTCARSPTRAC